MSLAVIDASVLAASYAADDPRRAVVAGRLKAGDALFAPAHIDAEIVSALRSMARGNPGLCRQRPVAVRRGSAGGGRGGMGRSVAIGAAARGRSLSSVLVDTAILIDYLRGHQGAAQLLEGERSAGAMHASEITRLEVLAGMRTGEEDQTRSLLTTLRCHPVDAEVAEKAGELGRAWLPSHHGIDGADLAIAATTVLVEARLLTLNVRHFPMFSGLTAPY